MVDTGKWICHTHFDKTLPREACLSPIFDYICEKCADTCQKTEVGWCVGTCGRLICKNCRPSYRACADCEKAIDQKSRVLSDLRFAKVTLRNFSSMRMYSKLMDVFKAEVGDTLSEGKITEKDAQDLLE